MASTGETGDPEYIISKSTQTCLTVTKGTGAHDAVIEMAKCSGSTKQQWFSSNGQWQWGGNRSFCLAKDKNGGLCLGSCNTVSESWNFDEKERLCFGDKALDVPWQSPRTRVILYKPLHNDANQKWCRLKAEGVKCTPVEWVACKDGENCCNPVPVVKGSAYLVAAAHHKGGVLPGLMIPYTKECYVCCDWSVHPKKEYLLLSNPSGAPLQWIAASQGHIPTGAIKGGKREHTGETLYVGRVNLDSTIVSGKVQPSAGGCYVPFWHTETHHENYEVLCYNW